MRAQYLLASAAALLSVTAPGHALDDARRRVIEEACPGFEREEKGPNGVLSPREVRCRLSMGETYEEIDADIRVLQRREAERQRRAAEALQAARERASRDRNAAQQAAPALCATMVQEYGEGRWFTSHATAPRLLTEDAGGGRKLDPAAVAGVARFMDRLGHNYAEPDQRALALSARSPEAYKQFDALITTVGAIAGDIQARAQQVQFYEARGRNTLGFVQKAPAAADYAFKCFLERQFGAVTGDPFDRAVKLDASGRYVGGR